MLNAIPANERRVRKYFRILRARAKPNSRSTISAQVIAKKVGDAFGPKIMIAGHMDEIGSIVTEIGKDGYVKFIPAGAGGATSSSASSSRSRQPRTKSSTPSPGRNRRTS
ncbi:MAG: hypothetical protein MZW92_02460 [Comamonadaceae bacterium]|nr:hypothetical protein [Comamonadaceae bacterium]